MAKPVPGQGDVAITLADGNEYFLRPNAKAAMTLSRQAGGIRAAVDKVLAMDLDVIYSIMRLGLGPHVLRELALSGAEFEDFLWRSGLTDSTSQQLTKCVEFLHVLANGGKPLNPEAKDEQQPGEQERSPARIN